MERLLKGAEVGRARASLNGKSNVGKPAANKVALPPQSSS
jgi:hypothetical protein